VRNLFIILVGKPVGKITGGPRSRYSNNIEMDLREI
jgi:hypothetical protein